MIKDIRTVYSIKTHLGMKYRSLPEAQRSSEGELYLLKNNLDLAHREMKSVLGRKEIVERKIEDIVKRINDLEAGLTRKKSSDISDFHSIRSSPKGALKVMKIDY